jgi:hypothetical protein
MSAVKGNVNWSAIASQAFQNSLTASLPPRLYRYRDTGEYTEKIFTEHELFFAGPNEFNDPFDCGCRILCQGDHNRDVIASQAIKAVRKKHPEFSNEEAFQAADQVSAKILVDHHEEASRQFGVALARDYNARVGILCLTATSTDILMWSHYADQHRGICLEFRTNIKDSIFEMAQRVSYADEYPHLDLLKLVRDHEFREAIPWMLTKSSFWSYEREWRILDFDNGRGVRKFPPECLSAVILGCCIPEKERKKILRWIRAFPAPVRVLQAKKSNTHFRLEIEQA